MFYLNVVDEEENRVLNESALYSKTTIACENNGIDYTKKHQQAIQAVDKYKDRPVINSFLLLVICILITFTLKALTVDLYDEI